LEYFYIMIDEERDTTIEQDMRDSGQIRNAESWLRDHGKPTYEHMMSLARTGTNESAEVIRELAENYNIAFDSRSTLQEMVQKIWSAMESSPDAV
jgi:hypothetical protein